MRDKGNFVPTQHSKTWCVSDFATVNCAKVRHVFVVVVRRQFAREVRVAFGDFRALSHSLQQSDTASFP